MEGRCQTLAPLWLRISCRHEFPLPPALLVSRLQLPVTLLYDYQSVSAVVEYINDQLTAGAAAAAGGTSGDADADASDSETEEAGRRAVGRSRGAAQAHAKPSDLLKMLRPPQPPRPLFLAAPGVANAQSAYFSFSQFLQASFVCVRAVVWGRCVMMQLAVPDLPLCPPLCFPSPHCSGPPSPSTCWTRTTTSMWWPWPPATPSTSCASSPRAPTCSAGTRTAAPVRHRGRARVSGLDGVACRAVAHD